MKRIERLGKKLSNMMLGGHAGGDANQVIREINVELASMAMEVTGVRADQLSDENMDDKPIVRLYWVTLSELTSKVLHHAADHQSYYKELDRD